MGGERGELSIGGWLGVCEDAEGTRGETRRKRGGGLRLRSVNDKNYMAGGCSSELSRLVKGEDLAIKLETTRQRSITE